LDDFSSALASSSPLLEECRLKSTIRRLRSDSQHSLICIVRLNSHGCAARAISTTFHRKVQGVTRAAIEDYTSRIL